MLLTAIIFS